MTQLRLLVAYDGGAFSGWQAQPGMRTVQGVLESALERLAAHPVRVTAAGRTDAGVHATGQVVSCARPRDMECDDLVRACAGLLPSDMSVLDAALAPADFSARHDALWRTYAYLVWNGPAGHPLLSRYSLWVPRALDAGLLGEALGVIEGTHDFSAFARVREDQSPERTVLEASALRDGDLVRITVRARSFLHQMVRGIVGSALEVALGRRGVDWMHDALDARDRARAGPVAPASGLTLVDVGYPEAPWRRAAGAVWPWAAPGSRHGRL